MDSEEISKSNGEENAPIVETESHDVSGNSVTEPEIQKDPDGNADNNNEHEKLSPRKWRGPPKNSDRYGIRHSLQKMAVKYAPPKIEGPKKPLHACTPCSRERQDVDATNYCQECDEKLCATCTTQHKKFQILKTHKVVGVDQAPQPEVKVTEKVKVTETCKLHANKIVDLYCPAHDQVGCAACIAVNHKGCPEAEYVSKVAPEDIKTGLAKQVKEELSEAKKEVLTLKLKRLDDKKNLIKVKTDILGTIEGMRKQIFDVFDKLEMEARDKLNTRFEQLMGGINKDVKSCEAAIGSVDASVLKLKEENELQLFVNVKKDCKTSLEKSKNAVEKIATRAGTENIEFKPDDSIVEWVSKLTSFGQFEHEVSIFTGIFFGKYDLDQKNDTEKENYVFNSLLNLPSGFTVASDWNNKRLKILDKNYSLRSHCDTPGMPYSLCMISPELIAVSLRDEKIIQFVSVDGGGKMKLDKKLKLDEFCRGLAYKENQLYVACGGGEGEIHGQLRVYSLNGSLLRVYKEDIQGKPFFAHPTNVLVNDEGTKFHVLDLKRGVVTITSDGRLVSVYKDTSVASPLGLAMDCRGNMFLCGSESNNVVQFNDDGQRLSEVLKEADGLTRPLSICYHESVNPRLIISFEGSQTVKVFTLQENDL